MTKVSNSGGSWSRGRLGSISIKKGLGRLFGGVEDEDDDEGFIIAIIGMVWGCESGLVSISGMRFSLSFIYLKVKEYCENHCDHLSNCAFGMVLFLRLSI